MCFKVFKLMSFIHFVLEYTRRKWIKKIRRRVSSLNISEKLHLSAEKF